MPVRKLVQDIPSNIGYDRNWYSVTEETFINFKIQACEAAKISLSRFLAIANIHTYEIILGAEGNSYTRITNVDSGEKVAEVSGSVLSKMIPHTDDVTLMVCSGCSSSDWFWLSWADGKIEVGKGDNVGSGLILSTSYDINVNAIGFASDDTQKANSVWEFDEPEGEFLLYCVEIYVNDFDQEPCTHFSHRILGMTVGLSCWLLTTTWHSK